MHDNVGQRFLIHLLLMRFHGEIQIEGHGHMLTFGEVQIVGIMGQALQENITLLAVGGVVGHSLAVSALGV